MNPQDPTLRPFHGVGSGRESLPPERSSVPVQNRPTLPLVPSQRAVASSFLSGFASSRLTSTLSQRPDRTGSEISEPGGQRKRTKTRNQKGRWRKIGENENGPTWAWKLETRAHNVLPRGQTQKALQPAALSNSAQGCQYFSIPAVRPRQKCPREASERHAHCLKEGAFNSTPTHSRRSLHRRPPFTRTKRAVLTDGVEPLQFTLAGRMLLGVCWVVLLFFNDGRRGCGGLAGLGRRLARRRQRVEPWSSDIHRLGLFLQPTGKENHTLWPRTRGIRLFRVYLQTYLVSPLCLALKENKSYSEIIDLPDRIFNSAKISEN